MEGLDPDGLLDLPPASWDRINHDLRQWAHAERANMKRDGLATCATCGPIRAAQARGQAPLREAELSLLEANRITPAATVERHNHMLLHPEAPSLERRKALQDLA